LPSDDMSQLRGARLFLSIDDNSIPPVPPHSTSTTTTTTTITTTQNDKLPNSQPVHKGWIAAVVLGVMVALLGLIGFIMYRRRLAASSGQTPLMGYRTGTDSVVSDIPNGTKANRSSIPTDSLKSPTSFVNPLPLYKKQELNNHQTEDSSNA